MTLDHSTASSFFSLMPLFSVIPFIRIYTEVKKRGGGGGVSLCALILLSIYDRFDSMPAELSLYHFAFPVVIENGCGSLASIRSF